MTDKPWFETENISDDQRAAFRSYQRHSNEQLAELVDKRLNKNSPYAWVFPTAKEVKNRRVLEAMLYTLHSMELKELKLRNEHLSTRDFFTKYYDSVSDENLPFVFDAFQQRLKSIGYDIHGLGNPTSPAEIRNYLIKVQSVLKNSSIYKGPSPL
jgi:hypothetical protein